MSIFSGLSIPQSRAQVAEQFNSFVEKVVSKDQFSIVSGLAAALGAAALMNIVPVNSFVTACLAGTAVYLWAENSKIEVKSAKTEMENQTLKATAVKANELLVLETSRADEAEVDTKELLSLKIETQKKDRTINKLAGEVSACTRENHSLKSDLIAGLNEIRSLKIDLGFSYQSIRNLHEIVRELRAANADAK